MEQALSLVFILAFNLIAVYLLNTERATGHRPYIKFALIAQSLTILWHGINILLTLDTNLTPALYLSNILAFSAGLFWLQASGFDNAIRHESGAKLIIGVYCILLALDSLWGSMSLVVATWFLIAVLYILIPIRTALSGTKRLPLAALQLTSAASMLSGIWFLQNGPVQIGGLFYFFNGLLTPTCAISFVLIAIAERSDLLNQQNKEYRGLHEALNVVFFRTRENGIIADVSTTGVVFGLEPERLIGGSLDVFSTEQFFSGELQKAIAAQNKFSLEATRDDDRGLQHVLIEAAPIRSERGHFDGYIGTVRDITENKRLQNQFIDSQRREGIGLLAGGMAHDFNNLMQGVIGHTELLLKNPNAPEQTKRLRSILNGANKAAELCRQLLHYAGKGHREITTLSIRSILDETITLLSATLPPDVLIKVVDADEEAFIRADPIQIHQVLMNILRNSIDALGESGLITVTTLPDRRTDRIDILIADNGPGIPLEHKERIFEPFFTTKPTGHGLGLAAVAGIMEAHAASITLDNDYYPGTRIKLSFPRETVDSIPATHDEEIDTTGPSLHVLVAEDDAVVRELVTTVLESLGHEITLARDGLEALLIYEAHPDDVDLLLSDLKMPGIDGLTLARKVREQSDTPVVLTSGNLDIEDQLTEKEAADFIFASKPFSIEQLTQIINEAGRRITTPNIDTVEVIS